MNLEEFKLAFDRFYNINQKSPYPRELTVRIKTNDPSMGFSSSVDVKSLQRGIDWDAGTFFIYPTEELVKKTNPRQLEINGKESDFSKEMIKTLSKFNGERESKLIVEVFKVLEKYYGK